jgi:uncharacterized protein (DUF697 family)
MTRKRLPRAIMRTDAHIRAIAASDFLGNASRVLEVKPEPESFPPSSNGQLQEASPAFAEYHSTKRRRLARKIVQRHETYAALAGLFPMPIVNVTSITAIIVRMVRQLSTLYDVPFEPNRTRSAIIGIIGGTAPTGVGIATASTLALAFPGTAIAGLAVSSLAAGAITRGIGLVFLGHFEGARSPAMGFASKG